MISLGTAIGAASAGQRQRIAALETKTVIVTGTEAVVTGDTQPVGTIRFATDTGRVMVSTGSTWVGTSVGPVPLASATSGSSITGAVTSGALSGEAIGEGTGEGTAVGSTTSAPLSGEAIGEGSGEGTAVGSVSAPFNTRAILLDGTNDYLSTNLVTDTYSLSSGFTASLWVKLDDVSTTQDFFGRYGNGSARFYFGISGTYVRAAIGNSWDASTITHGMSTGTWYHIAYTFSGGSSGTFTYYLNGSSVGTRAYTWTADSSSYEPMHIGGLKNGGNLYQNPTNGKMDEFALYNSELSSSEISAIYNSGTPADQSSDSNLVAYWRMEEGTGTTVADSSSNSNTATLNNGPTFSTDVP